MAPELKITRNIGIKMFAWCKGLRSCMFNRKMYIFSQLSLMTWIAAVKNPVLNHISTLKKAFFAPFQPLSGHVQVLKMWNKTRNGVDESFGTGYDSSEIFSLIPWVRVHSSGSALKMRFPAKFPTVKDVRRKTAQKTSNRK